MSQMRAILCAAGSGSRWNNYTGRRKHVSRVDGEPLLARTVRLLRERGVTDIHITHLSQHPYVVPGATSWVRPADVSHMIARKLTWPRWNEKGRTLLLLGDTYFTDDAMDRVVKPTDQWVQYGRLQPSKATGKPGAEMFGWQFGPGDHHDFVRAIETVEAAKDRGEPTYNDWSIYCAFVNRPLDTNPEKIRDWGNHVELADDGTDDFDFPDDYERWMSHFGRSGRRVLAADFFEDWFKARTQELNLAPKLHRKLWEHCSIAQAYRDRIGSGGSVLGFGVGRESLPAWFAAQGAEVLATDRPEPGVWLDRQHSTGKVDLRYEGICDKKTFSKVEYRPLDMRKIPESLHGKFDFTWSSSCFEHLGSIKAGLDFFAEQMKCLKQGGIAVHTTEYNYNYTSKALETENLSLFRQKDLLDLTHRLHAQGDRLWPLHLEAGDDPADRYEDTEPYQIEPHLNLRMGSWAFTSVLLVAGRGV